MAEVKLEERIGLASSSLSFLLSHLLQHRLCLGKCIQLSEIAPSPCLHSWGIPAGSRTESRRMKNSGWKTQHHFHPCDHVGFPVFWAALGLLEGEQNPEGAPSKANQGCPTPRTACEPPRNLQSTAAKPRSVRLSPLRNRQRAGGRARSSARLSLASSRACGAALLELSLPGWRASLFQGKNGHRDRLGAWAWGQNQRWRSPRLWVELPLYPLHRYNTILSSRVTTGRHKTGAWLLVGLGWEAGRRLEGL